MKKAALLSIPSKFVFRLVLRCLRFLPKKRCLAFNTIVELDQPRIQHIYVINLKRQPDRLGDMKNELCNILDSTGGELWNLVERYEAIDAKFFLHDLVRNADVDPIYTLSEQLFVEPQPLAMPTLMELDAPIRMSRPEIAVAESHIGVWRQLAASSLEYVLILEDDVWFRPGFSQDLNKAWAEIIEESGNDYKFDILYLSYEEVKHGAPKTFLSQMIFQPERGLWNLSGYVISRRGAEKLLRLLPCKGPVDLWLNHQFKYLNVLAIKRSVINQRPDLNSTNAYSILPSLTRIGAINSEAAALFHADPTEFPVFVFGPKHSGLTSIAMGRSMLGYRCCNDLEMLPKSEMEMLFSGKANRIFSAYVNIMCLTNEIGVIKANYPRAKFLIAKNNSALDNSYSTIIDILSDTEIIIVDVDAPNKWQIICEYLRCAPPACSFPELVDLGQRKISSVMGEFDKVLPCEIPKRDKSPWIIGADLCWQGIASVHEFDCFTNKSVQPKYTDFLKSIDGRCWLLRDDTFIDNLALFRPANVEILEGNGVALIIKKEHLGVREFSAAAITSRDRYLYGRFEAIIKASKVPGVVTGFFLHRDSPRQEIDVEISGNRTDRLMVNVYYNPGAEGAKFDYGYRGAASYINLGFDASESYHKYTIEWEPNVIRWLVDDRLVHKRIEWNPTPIPHLPMSLHVNLWPCRSKELAGRIIDQRFPTNTFIKSIALEANSCQVKNPYENTLL